MATTYMFNKGNRKNVTSTQRQALSIIQSFFTSFAFPTSSLTSSSFLSTFPAPLFIPYVFPQEKQEAGKETSKKGKNVNPKIGNQTKEVKNQKVLLGKPLFSVTPNKITIQLFYYGTSSISNEKLTLLGNALTGLPWHSQSKLAGTNPTNHVELQVIRLKHSVLDSSIFAQYLTDNAGKYSFNRIIDMLKNNLPTVSSDGSLDNSLNPTSHITGIKVKLSGRLTTQQSGPRQTVQAGRIGSSAKGFYGTIDYSQHTSKNKLGAFTMKV